MIYYSHFTHPHLCHYACKQYCSDLCKINTFLKTKCKLMCHFRNERDFFYETLTINPKNANCISFVTVLSNIAIDQPTHIHYLYKDPELGRFSEIFPEVMREIS